MPLTRRQIYRRRRITVFASLLVIVAAVVYSMVNLTAALPAAASTVTQPAALTQPAANLVWPGYGRGAVGAVGFGMLGTTGEQTAAPMASITKVVTALVVLDAKPIDDGGEGPDITYTDEDVDIYYEQVADDASVAPVRDGLVLSERQSLTMMLLPSAANYAISLAVWAYGSEDAYLEAANAWLAAHGMKDTRVVDTSGLSDDSAGTPADIVKLGELAVADPIVSAIVAQSSAEVPGVGTIENSNHLIGSHGVDGIKTGTNDNAGACLLFSADYTVGDKTVTVVGVMLGGLEMADHAELNRGIGALLDSVVPGFHQVQLVKEGQKFASYSNLWGDKAEALATKSESVLVWSDTPIAGATVADTLTTADDGSTVGSVTYTVGEDAVKVPLVLDGSLSDPGAWWRLTHPGELAG